MDSAQIRADKPVTDPLTLDGRIQGTFDPDTQLDVHLGSVADAPIPLTPGENLFFLTSDGQRTTSVTLNQETPFVDIVAEISSDELEKLRQLGIRNNAFSGSIDVDAGSSFLNDGNKDSQSAQPQTLQWRFGIDVRQPFFKQTWFRILAGILGLLATLLLLWLIAPRFPKGAQLVADDDTQFNLRARQARSLWGRLFGGKVRLGDSSGLDLNLDRTFAQARGRWFWPKGVKLKALADGVEVNNSVLGIGESISLDDSDDLAFEGDQFVYRSDADVVSEDEIDFGDYTSNDNYDFG